MWVVVLIGSQNGPTKFLNENEKVYFVVCRRSHGILGIGSDRGGEQEL